MIGNKRERLSLDHDRKLVDMLARYISELSQRYDLSVAVGRSQGNTQLRTKGQLHEPILPGCNSQVVLL